MLTRKPTTATKPAATSAAIKPGGNDTTVAVPITMSTPKIKAMSPAIPAPPSNQPKVPVKQFLKANHPISPIFVPRCLLLSVDV